MQRPLNSSTPEGIARSGAQKKIATPKPVVGHASQVTGSAHPFLHGQTKPLEDGPNKPLPKKSHEKVVGYHTGNTDKQIIADVNSATAGQVLDGAACHGRNKDKVC